MSEFQRLMVIALLIGASVGFLTVVDPVRIVVEETYGE